MDFKRPETAINWHMPSFSISTQTINCHARYENGFLISLPSLLLISNLLPNDHHPLASQNIIPTQGPRSSNSQRLFHPPIAHHHQATYPSSPRKINPRSRRPVPFGSTVNKASSHLPPSLSRATPPNALLWQGPSDHVIWTAQLAKMVRAVFSPITLWPAEA